MVSPSCASVPAVVIAAPASGSGKTTVATGLMGALRCAGRGCRAVQGRARLHRPRLPRACGAPAGPQSRPGAGRRAVDRPAVPARHRGGGHRGHRGRDGPVRRADRRDLHRHRAGIHRARRRAAGRTGHSRRRRPRPGSQHCRTAAWLLDVRHGGPGRRCDPQPGRLAASRGGVAPGMRACGRRRSSARSRAPTSWPSRHGISGWSPPSSTASRHARRSRR